MCLRRSPHAPQGGRSAPRVLSSMSVSEHCKVQNVFFVQNVVFLLISTLFFLQNSPYQDLEGADGGQGYFHDVANPGKGQGKKIGKKDLHEHLLTETYNYNDLSK